MQTFDPHRAVIPILRATKAPTISELLGTGFYTRVGGKLRVVTAKHVFEDNPLKANESYAYAFKEGNEIKISTISELNLFKNCDVAFFDPRENHDAVPLPFAETLPPLNRDIICYEYSNTRIERQSSGGVHVSLQPFAHRGNVMQFIESELPPYVSSPCLVVSFAALRGASGAPVISNTDKKNFYVAGMIVANMGRHLMPAQIEKYSSADGGTEQVSYYLPLGLAINGRVLRSELRTIGEIEYVA